MSATLHLFKVIDDVEYIGKPSDKVKWNNSNTEALDKIERELGYRDNMSVDEQVEFYKMIDRISFSDGKEHKLLDVNYYRAIYKRCRGLRRFIGRLRRFNTHKYTNANGWTYNYIVVDEVEYRQGWFLKNRFFRKEITTVFCTTKKELEAFIKQYIDFTKPQGREAAEVFLKTFKPGMILECSW